MHDMTLGADEPRDLELDGTPPCGTGFRIAVAAWVPLILFLLVAITPQSPPADCDQGIWDCTNGIDWVLAIILVPGTFFTVGLAMSARYRAWRVLEAVPGSKEAETASTVMLMARLAVVATIVAWVWLVWTWHS
jgi:hypothetical protein